MKNKLTLSELRNVIKEEIQFQLTKKQLFENLDKKTLKRILKEEESELAPVDVSLQFTNIKVNYDTENTSGFAIISNNSTDTFNAIADNEINFSYFMFNIIFKVSLPQTYVKDGIIVNKEINTFLNDYIKKNIYKFSNDSLQITNYAAPITVAGQEIKIKSASIVAKYPAAIITDLNKKPSDIFNLGSFKGKSQL